jgi:hypothetical protein
MLLDQLGYAQEALPHVLRERLELSLDTTVQDLYAPSHGALYLKKEMRPSHPYGSSSRGRALSDRQLHAAGRIPAQVGAAAAQLNTRDDCSRKPPRKASRTNTGALAKIPRKRAPNNSRATP